MAIELDDGTIIRSLPEQVTKNKEDVEDLQNDLTSLEQQVASALAGVFHYKGSVATYGDLPSSGNEVGDVWNVLADGKNYAWSGSAWDDLGGIVDLSNYVTLDGTQTISGAKTFSQSIGAINRVTFGQGGVITDLQGGIRFTDYNSVSLDYENAALFPAIDNTVDLGSLTNKFKEISVNQINLGTSGILKYENSAISVNDDIIPATTESYDLGSDSNLFNRLYTTILTINNPNVSGGRWTFVSGSYVLYLRLGSIEQTYYFFESSVFRSPSHVPTYTNTYDLGSSSYTWKDIYFSGNIKTTNYNIKEEGGYIAIQRAGGNNAAQIGASLSKFRQINSVIDNYYDLGETNIRWKDLYLSGNLSDGTNSVNIADLKALIDYAKAQGWIS